MNPIVIPFRTDPTDLRGVLADNAIRDMLAESDARDLVAMRIAVGATEPGVRFMAEPTAEELEFLDAITREPYDGEAVAGGITRETLADAMRMMREQGIRGRPANRNSFHDPTVQGRAAGQHP